MNIKKLETVRALSQDSRILISKTFLGLGTKVTYVPTGSSVKVIKAECSAETGRQMESLLKSSGAAFDKTLAATPKFVETSPGNFLLEGLLSADHEYVALRLYHYADFKYNPATDLVVYEGEQARKMAALF